MNFINEIRDSFESYITSQQNLEDLKYSLAVFAITSILFFIFRKYLILRIEKITTKTTNELDDKLLGEIKQIGLFFYFIIEVFILSKILQARSSQLLDNFEYKIIDSFSIVVIALYLTKIFNTVILYGINLFIKNKNKKGINIDTSILNIIDLFVKILVWSIVFLFCFQTLGYDATAIITGLGVGGIAIAFALQSVLGDLFASITIYLDKPFKSGEVIEYKNTIGIVKRIGVKSTRIESLDGEEFVVSNKLLTDSTLKNYSKLKRRRSVVNLGVTYETDRKILKKIPAIIEKVIQAIEKTDLVTVNFKEFGDFSLNFELIFYVNSSSYEEFMKIQEEVLFGIDTAFSKNKIEFAYPTQTVLLKK